MATSTRLVVLAGALALIVPAAVPAQADEQGPGDPPPEKRAAPRIAGDPPALAAGVIVKLRVGAESAVLRDAAEAALGEATVVSKVAPRVRAFESPLVPLGEAQAVAAELELREDVLWAEPNGIRWPGADTPWPIPVNDPYAVSLRNVWDMRGPENDWVSGLGVTPWPVGGYGTKAPTLWPATTGGGLVVGVLDTGIIANHPDLAPNLVSGYDMITNTLSANDGDGRDSNPSDPGDWATAGLCTQTQQAKSSSWHGTHVAGTIGAVANNGQGVVGVAPGVRIQPVRVLGRCGGSDADIATGIMWAAGVPVPGLPANPTPAKILNLSLWGPGSCSQTYVDAINATRGVGATLVVILGNANKDAAGYTPANCPGVIGIHAVSDYGDHASYSNYGAAADVSGPGGDKAWGENGGILSTVDSGTTTPAGPSYGWMHGTSMAAPAVAGVAAMLASIGQFGPDSLEAAIRAAVTAYPTASASGFIRCNQSCGTGIIDASRVPAPVGGPGISGSPVPGQVLTATAARWIGPSTGRAYTWYANGLPVGNGVNYVVAGSDVGKSLVVRESVASGPFAPIGASSGSVVVAPPTSTPPAPPPSNPPATTSRARLRIKAPATVSAVTRARIVVIVKVDGVRRPVGKVVVKDGRNKIAQAKLRANDKGVEVFRLPRLAVGKHRITASFKGSGAKGRKTISIRVRR